MPLLGYPLAPAVGRPVLSDRMAGTRSHSFDVYYRRGWIYLVVHPGDSSGGSGESSPSAPVYPDDIENRMRLLGMPRVRSAQLREHIDEATGQPVRLVEWPEGARLAPKISVELSDDEMAASVTITPPQRGAAPPEPGDIIEALHNAGVTFGIDEDVIGELVRAKRYDTAVSVAAGRAPVFGTARRIEYRFKQDRGKPYLHLAFDRINLKELNFIDNRREGDLLAVILPPVKAVDGSTVTGTRIPASRDETVVTIPAGENTRLNADRSELFAACDGNARFRDGLVVVEPIIEVENVNYETGNIHFDGSVVITGSVADGFVVEAGGTIQVGRSVGRAHLRARENILLQSGMNGNGEGVLECGGNLFARYLESCTVRCKGNLFVEEAIMHSTVTVWNHCILNGRRAECIGGEYIVGGSLWCRKLGNQYDAPTAVAIGVPPELLEEYRTAKKELDAAEDELEKLEEKLHRIEHAIDEGRTDEKFLAARDQLRQDMATATARIGVSRRRVPALRDRLDPATASFVVAEEMIFNGTIVTFGKQEYRPAQAGSRKTILRMAHGEIHADGFNRQDPPTLEFTLPV
jgi:uncharacterized protein (DUF342 family)